MKRKITKISFLMLCCIFLVLSHALGQNFQSIKDTVYIVLCRSMLENGRPIASYIILKDTSVFNELKSIDDRDSYMCELFKRSTLFKEPAFTLVKNKIFYQFQSESEANLFFSRQSKLMKKLTNAYKELSIKKFTKGRDISFDVAKISGEFWSINKKQEDLNDTSESFTVAPGCYTKSYIYNLKSIEKIYNIR
ncbi:MAG: hypothetical protein ABI203_01280 [Mucilaginibacter sp.]